MKLNSMMAAFAVTALVAGTTARAGYKVGYPVQIDTVNRSASGTLGTVRDTTDTAQYIGCNIHASSTTGATIYCTAADAQGVSAACSSSAQSLLQVLTTLQSDSHLAFKWDASGACTYISVDTSSAFTPKSP